MGLLSSSRFCWLVVAACCSVGAGSAAEQEGGGRSDLAEVPTSTTPTTTTHQVATEGLSVPRGGLAYFGLGSAKSMTVAVGNAKGGDAQLVDPEQPTAVPDGDRAMQQDVKANDAQVKRVASAQQEELQEEAKERLAAAARDDAASGVDGVAAPGGSTPSGSEKDVWKIADKKEMFDMGGNIIGGRVASQPRKGGGAVDVSNEFVSPILAPAPGKDGKKGHLRAASAYSNGPMKVMSRADASMDVMAYGAQTLKRGTIQFTFDPESPSSSPSGGKGGAGGATTPAAVEMRPPTMTPPPKANEGEPRWVTVNSIGK